MHTGWLNLRAGQRGAAVPVADRDSCPALQVLELEQLSTGVVQCRERYRPAPPSPSARSSDDDAAGGICVKDGTDPSTCPTGPGSGRVDKSGAPFGSVPL